MLTRRAEAELRHRSGREGRDVVRWRWAEGEERERLRWGEDSNGVPSTKMKTRTEMQAGLKRTRLKLGGATVVGIRPPERQSAGNRGEEETEIEVLGLVRDSRQWVCLV